MTFGGSRQAIRVKRRRVFYIPGYDPFHPRRYRELYRTESAAQAEISGYEIEVSGRAGQGRPNSWHVRTQIDGQETIADVDVLVWSDIVRESMSNSIPATYWQLVRTAWTYIASGTLRRLMWLRKGPVIAALYPIGMLLLQLLLALFAAWLLATVVNRSVDAVLGLIGLEWFIIADALSTAAGFALAVWILRWFKRKDGKFFAYYLMHDYAYSARWQGANPAPLEERMAAFADEIAAAFDEESIDEVLVVGHSSGAHLAISILADLIRQGRIPLKKAALGFLSLGQVVPMVSFLPKAERLRGDLYFLSQREELTWLDVTAPGDGCAFALCDPVAVTGLKPPQKRWPLVISAAFTQSLSPERWKELRWRFFRLHFQYLCAFDRPKDYDYFQITAGPMTLADRFEGRPPSKSRIDVGASKYTSVPE